MVENNPVAADPVTISVVQHRLASAPCIHYVRFTAISGSGPSAR